MHCHSAPPKTAREALLRRIWSFFEGGELLVWLFGRTVLSLKCKDFLPYKTLEAQPASKRITFLSLAERKPRNHEGVQ